MKKVFLFLLISTFMLSAKIAAACEIGVTVDQVKDSYHAQDEVVLTITVELSHRRCDVDIEDTQFSTTGMEILGATKWVQLNSMTYARKLKVKISSNTSSAQMKVDRKCDEDGGHGELTLKIS